MDTATDAYSLELVGQRPVGVGSADAAAHADAASALAVADAADNAAATAAADAADAAGAAAATGSAARSVCADTTKPSWIVSIACTIPSAYSKHINLVSKTIFDGSDG